MIGSAISACTHTMNWKEEVKLHDGQVIVEKQSVNLGGYLYLDSTERVSLDETATFRLKSGKSVTWKTDFRDSEPEPNSLNMIRFDIVDDVPYLATYPAGCIAYNKWGRPNPPQMLFKYEGDHWKRITLNELPKELIGKTANVIVGTPAQSLLKSFYTAGQVDAKNHYVREYMTILREPVKGGDSVVSCEVLVNYKCGWGAPGEFNRKYFEHTCK